MSERVLEIKGGVLEGAFMFTGLAGDLKLPKSLKTIPEDAFSQCNITSVEIPASVELVEKDAFANCPHLVGVSIPENVRVHPKAFRGCENLQVEDLAMHFVELSSDLTNEETANAPVTEARTSKGPDRSSRGMVFPSIFLMLLGGLAAAWPLAGGWVTTFSVGKYEVTWRADGVAIEWLFVAFLLCGGGYALAAALGRKSCGTGARVVLGVWAGISLLTCLLLAKSGSSLLSLTALLAGYFAAQGLLAISTAFAFSRTGRLWLMLLSGVVSLVLGWVVFSGFVGSGPMPLTLLFGANLFFTGLYFLSMSPRTIQ